MVITKNSFSGRATVASSATGKGWIEQVNFAEAFSASLVSVMVCKPPNDREASNKSPGLYY